MLFCSGDTANNLELSPISNLSREQHHTCPPHPQQTNNTGATRNASHKITRQSVCICSVLESSFCDSLASSTSCDSIDATRRRISCSSATNFAKVSVCLIEGFKPSHFVMYAHLLSVPFDVRSLHPGANIRRMSVILSFDDSSLTFQ